MAKYKAVVEHVVEELQAVAYIVDADSFDEAKELGEELANNDGLTWPELVYVEDTITGERVDYDELY